MFMQSVEDVSDDEEDDWAAINTYANYRPTKCEYHIAVYACCAADQDKC